MLLVIDIGNSNTVLGLYQGEQLEQHWRIGTSKSRTVDEYGILIGALFRHEGVALEAVDAIIVSCVVPPMLPTIQELCLSYFGKEPRVVGPGIKTGMPILYDNPKEVGADRIVNAVAAYEKYKEGLIVVDFGTATTFDVITPQGQYQGGAIAPGVGISAEALFSRASKLPRVEFSKPPQVVARNTVNSMQAGIFWGYVGLVEGLVQRIRQEMDFPVRVVATGGLAGPIADATSLIESVENDLTLEGLRIIHSRN